MGPHESLTLPTAAGSRLNRRLLWSTEGRPSSTCGTHLASTSSISKASLITLTLPLSTAGHTILQMSSLCAFLSAILSPLTVFKKRYPHIHNVISACAYLRTIQWLPALKHHRPDVSIILVGTKPEFRVHPDTMEALRKRNKTPITFEQGQSMAQDIGATTYLEFWATVFTESFSKVPQSASAIMEAVASCL